MANDLDTIAPILVELAEVSYQNAVHTHQAQINPSASFTDTLVLTTLDTLLALAICQPHYLMELAHMRRRAGDTAFTDPAGIARFTAHHPLTPHDPIT